jgi:hypothetical protein
LYQKTFLYFSHFSTFIPTIMPFYNGNEYDSEKGTHGSLLKFIWKKIYSKFQDVAGMISTALADYYTKSEIDTKVDTLTTSISNEATSRANADNDLQAQILGLKTITEWNANEAFPTLRSDGQAFQKGNYVRVTNTATIGGVKYKAGDILIAFVDGATTVAGFADVESNVDIATSSIYGTVKLLADLASYQGSGNDSVVITKVTLQAILADLSSTLTTSFTDADTALQTAITTAYETAIADALTNYYTKTQIDGFLNDKMSKAKGVELAGIIQNEVFQALRRVSNRITTYVAKTIGEAINSAVSGGIATLKTADTLVLLFSGLGVRLLGKNVLGSFPSSWASIADSDKADFDYFKYTSGGVSKLYFNPDALTDAEANSCTVLVSNNVSFAESELSSFLDSTANGGVGNDNGTTDTIIPDYILTLQSPN